jgi:class 3 adenylate cyclase/tetratricopeptide (TPR) repeat protein
MSGEDISLTFQREPLRVADARRRYLAILFSDLTGSVRLGAHLEAEDVADLLGSLRHVYEEVISKHGGVIVQIRGDGVLACFGYPDAREDDGRRATEAALELHDRVRRMEFSHRVPAVKCLRLHSGIHAGLVLLEGGDAAAGRLELIGSATNIAARLSDSADSDEILVSRETLGGERNFFVTDAGHLMQLQGLGEPVMVHRVTGRADVGTRFEARSKHGLTPFVGRDAELQILTDHLKRAMRGALEYWAVAAGPGLGKTRLSEEFIVVARRLGCDVYRGYCESYLSAEPAQPFLQMLRSMCRVTYGLPSSSAAEALEAGLARIDPALLKWRAVLLGGLSLTPLHDAEGKDRHSPENVVAAIVAVIDALAATRPLVLFIDDWQWSDDAARQVLSAIRAMTGRPIFLLVATREVGRHEIGLGEAQRLELKPLTVDATEQAIGHLLPGQNKFIVEEIREYSGGNPLFLEELCHSATSEQMDHLRGVGRGGKAWLDKLIVCRVERLPPEQIELVRMAAVIGNIVPLQVLERLTGCGADHPFVVALRDEDLIYPAAEPGILRFKHGIARDVIYDSVSPRVRRTVHERVAGIIRQQAEAGQEEEYYEPLAYHYAASGNAEEAARYAERAGDKAMAASALDRAQIHYLAALKALGFDDLAQPHYERWISIVQRLALACVFDPSREQLEVLLRAIELAAKHEDRAGASRAHYWAGYVYYALGESASAIRHLEIAIDSAGQGGDAAFVRQARATLGQAYAAACEYVKSSLLLQDAIDGRRQAKGNRPAIGFAYTLACKASVLGDHGRFEEAYACFDEALEAIRGSGHQVEGSVLCWQSGVFLWQGRWDEAEQAALEAQRVGERVRSLYLYAMGISLAGYAGFKKDGSAASLQAIAEATSWLESRKRGLFISLNYGWLAEGMAAQGRWPEARRHTALALRRQHRHDRIGAAMALRAMARASAAGQNRKPAHHYLGLATENAVSRNAPHEVAVTQLCEAEISLAWGAREDARRLTESAASAFAAMGMTWHLQAARALQQAF